MDDTVSTRWSRDAIVHAARLLAMLDCIGQDFLQMR